MAQLEIIRGDITTLEVDAIVNAANEHLAPGGGVCGAIHNAAGPGLADECAGMGGCPTGECRITGGHRLPAGHVIHCVGPVWHGGGSGEAGQLAGCYRHAIELAGKNGIASIAFPAISTGIFGYPLDQACDIAVSAVREAAAKAPSVTRVAFVCFDERTEAAFRAALTNDDETGAQGQPEDKAPDVAN